MCFKNKTNYSTQPWLLAVFLAGRGDPALLNSNPSHKYDWIRIMQGRKLKHILNRQNTSHPSNVFCFSQITNANLQCTVCCILAPCILKIYFSKCIPQSVSKYISRNVFLKMSQNIFLKCIPQNMCVAFLKIYSSKYVHCSLAQCILKICFSKCIPQKCISQYFQNVFLKMYFPKCIEISFKMPLLL